MTSALEMRQLLLVRLSVLCQKGYIQSLKGKESQARKEFLGW